MFTKVKTAVEIDAMRTSGRILASVLDVLHKSIEAGMTTKDLAEIAGRELKALGGKPVFLGYQGFPDVLCVSVNDEVVHGIPSRQRELNDGDIVGMDFGVVYDGMITDSAISVIVGGDEKHKSSKQLVKTTERAMYAGIDTVKAGVRTGDIAAAVQEVLSEKDYGIVRELVGHGVGHQLHEEPNIPNYGRKGTGPALKAGMTVAIEPMATQGSGSVYIGDDGWTVSTRDGSLAAHFEHTVLVTETGAEILTAL